MLKRTLSTLMILGMFASLLIVACQPKGEGAERMPVKPASMFFERAYNFCSDRIQDRFLIGYFGNEILNSQIHFYVVCHRGDTIYHDSWPATAFLGELDAPSDSVRIASIRKEMLAFVNGSTGPHAIVVQDSVQKTFDLGQVFQYGIAGQNPKAIAYSHTQKAVIEL
ncbi:MAG TPA: hypothetical protein ENJ82_14925 [Bacteroidetes bacterium]|nr:hypothetical protein [Bacteroidota bacterium]